MVFLNNIKFSHVIDAYESVKIQLKVDTVNLGVSWNVSIALLKTISKLNLSLFSLIVVSY